MSREFKKKDDLNDYIRSTAGAGRVNVGVTNDEMNNYLRTGVPPKPKEEIPVDRKLTLSEVDEALKMMDAETGLTFTAAKRRIIDAEAEAHKKAHSINSFIRRIAGRDQTKKENE